LAKLKATSEIARAPAFSSSCAAALSITPVKISARSALLIV